MGPKIVEPTNVFLANQELKKYKVDLAYFCILLDMLHSSIFLHTFVIFCVPLSPFTFGISSKPNHLFQTRTKHSKKLCGFNNFFS